MEKKHLHPLIPEAQNELRKGNLSRRDFLRLSSLLGVSLATSQFLAACAQDETAEPTQAPVVNDQPEPAAPTIKRGGVLRCANRVDRVDHPARFSLVNQSHPWRHVFEYLTYTDPQGITHPYLLDSWTASDDLLTWTLVLKKGIKFNNGKDFTADDVLFNFQQWLSEEVGSSLLGAMNYLDPNGQEKIDDYTVVCKLRSPSIFLPEHLFSYQACIVPAGFGGDITLEPIGTGAFTMEEYVPGERCRLVARKDYWRNGEDGQPLPYLDEIIIVQLGDDPAADLAAMQTGQVDTVLEPPVSVWEGIKGNANVVVEATPTAATRVLRMRVDQEPWSDNRVRQALKYCHNREKILAVALQNQGIIGNDSHIAPSQPESTGVAPYPFDTAMAKQLLTEAGYGDGLAVDLVVPSDWPESMAYAQALQEDAAAAGFNITLKTMPASQYWDGWTEWNLGITWWAHRPHALMLLPQAYIADDAGNPVPWNETKWIDDEFTGLLNQAIATIDLEDRRKLTGQMEVIQKERGSICTPFYMSVWKIYAKNVKGIVPSPEEYGIFYETWLDK